MSKKRKTRKEKEKATIRHEKLAEQKTTSPSVSYTVKDISEVTAKKKTAITKVKIPSNDSSQVKYLKHDIRTIYTATGLILAFDILLFTLLSTGVLNLGFLGY